MNISNNVYILTNNGSSYPLGHNCIFVSNIVYWNNHAFRTNSHITNSHTNLHIHSVAYISIHFNNCNLTLMHLCYSLCYFPSLPCPFIHHLMFWTIHAIFRQFNICDRLQENRAQRGTLRKIFFCTYRVAGVQILSSPSFIVVV